MRRPCSGLGADGRPCRAAPMIEGLYCFMHDPDHAEEAAEARRVGGLRRRREGTIAGAFDLGPLDTMPGIVRLLEIATTDSLGLENSLKRSRTLIAAAVVAARLFEAGELDARLRAMEAARNPAPPAVGPDSLLDEDE